MQMDSLQVEILGRHRLSAELMAAGIEVALPLRHRGVDLIAYVGPGSQTTAFAGCPIKMKAASVCYFGVHRLYEKFANILLAYVWGIGEPDLAATYALTFPEAVAVATTMEWTKTASWEQAGYSTSNPSAKLMLLEPYRMTAAKWVQKVTAIHAAVTRDS
jgi:hypothetical protein